MFVEISETGQVVRFVKTVVGVGQMEEATGEFIKMVTTDNKPGDYYDLTRRLITRLKGFHFPARGIISEALQDYINLKVNPGLNFFLKLVEKILNMLCK